MNKLDPLPSSAAAAGVQSQSVPIYRIGDLVWCQEARNNKLWWPAMVTYDPHQGIFYRTTKQKCQQYHVQYFGIKAIRGWVSSKSCSPISDAKEKAFDEKGLSKKAKTEYEVAIQEVTEAAKLDHKQRKLKFIFSFESSGKRHKSKQKLDKESSSRALPVKVESKEDTDSDHSSKPKYEVTVQDAKRKFNGSVSIPKTSCGDSVAVDPLPKGRGSTRRSSGRVKAMESSLSDDNKSKLEAGGVLSARSTRNSKTDATAKDDSSQTKTAKRGVPTNGEWVAGRGKKAADVPVSPLCLHSQHSSLKAVSTGRRSRSTDTNHLDCDRCLDYIINGEGLELKCTSDPEVLIDSGPEVSMEPILMYVQKQYGRSKNGPPNLNRNPLSKGMSTRNLSTDLLSGSTKQPFHLATHLKGRDRGRKSSGQSNSPSPPVFSAVQPFSSNGSESEYETGKSIQLALSASRKRKRRTTLSSSSVSSLVSSPLIETHSLEASGEEEAEAATKKRKRGKSLSTSSLHVEITVNSKKSEILATEGNEAESSPVKGSRRASANYSEPMVWSSHSANRTRRNSAIQKNPMLNSVLLADNSSASANDSGSEASLTASTLTPATSSSEESPSVDFEFNNPATELSTSRSQSLSLTTKEKKKLPKQPMAVASESNKIGVCSICDCEDTDLLACTGHCMNWFHLDCLGLVGEPSFKFLCDECLISSGTCFVCGKGHGEVKKCSKPRCSKLYHLDCIRDNKLFQRLGKGKSSSFTCPLHVCARCTSIGVSSISHSNLLQCIRCPLALHKPDCLVAGCEVIDHAHMLCYQHIKITKNTKLYSHININTCLECGVIGELYCCDVCSAAYHSECLDQDARPTSDTNHWKCPSCTIHDLPTYGSLVITKFGVWRWWPSEVVHPEDIPDNIMLKKPGECMFVVRFCGSRDFCWTYHGKVLPYTDEAELEGLRGRKKPKASDNYKKACEEAKEINKTRRKVLEAKEEARQNSKFYTKIKTNKYLVPRPPLDPESLDFLPCQCTPENPCNEDSTCVNRASHIECNPKNCPVGDLCQNQRMQKYQNAKTEPVFTGNRGWGLKATANLSAGDFVIEYVGEVLDDAMCEERLKRAHAQNNNNFYMLKLDARLVVDACRKSNHARFINHSCGPNCVTQKWRVKGEARIGIFARQNIPTGTELTFNYYLDSLGNEMKKCFCGSKNCSGFLGLRSSKVVSEEEMKARLKVKKKKKPRPRQPIKKEEEDVAEDRHDDECFICRDGGELLLCDRKTCCRAYHLECISRKVVPPKSQKWECPWHFCTQCQKAAVTFCSLCPVSYCSKHLKDRLFKRDENNILVCQGCLDHVHDGTKVVAESKPLHVSASHKPESSKCEEEAQLNKSEVHDDPPSIGKPGKPAQVRSGEKMEEEANQAFSTPDTGVAQLSPEAGLTSKANLSPPVSSSDPSQGRSQTLAGLLASNVQQTRADPNTAFTSDVRKSPDSRVRSPLASSQGHTPIATPTTISSYHCDEPEIQRSPLPTSHFPRVSEPLRSPSAFRTCLTNKTTMPLFQPQSPTFGQSYSAAAAAAAAAAASAFQQPHAHTQQSPPMCNSLINPVWLMPRNGLMNGLDAGASSFGYPPYPLINHHSPIGFSYPGHYFGEPMIPSLESFNLGMHHQLPSSSTSGSAAGIAPAAATALPPPTSSSFPAAVFPPTHPQNGFLAAWKYC